jgi:hypothetical protein
MPMADDGQREVYSWSDSVAFALVGTVAVIVLIFVFTALEDLVGQFWSQLIYFPTIAVAVIAAALRSRRLDSADPTRLTKPAPITPAGLPGPFVVTQALGVAGLVMIVVGLVLGGDAQLMWIASGFVLALTGGVGLVFWLSGRPWQLLRRT